MMEFIRHKGSRKGDVEDVRRWLNRRVLTEVFLRNGSVTDCCQAEQVMADCSTV